MHACALPVHTHAKHLANTPRTRGPAPTRVRTPTYTEDAVIEVNKLLGNLMYAWLPHTPMRCTPRVLRFTRMDEPAPRMDTSRAAACRTPPAAQHDHPRDPVYKGAGVLPKVHTRTPTRRTQAVVFTILPGAAQFDSYHDVRSHGARPTTPQPKAITQPTARSRAHTRAPQGTRSSVELVAGWVCGGRHPPAPPRSTAAAGAARSWEQARISRFPVQILQGTHRHSWASGQGRFAALRHARTCKQANAMGYITACSLF